MRDEGIRRHSAGDNSETMAVNQEGAAQASQKAQAIDRMAVVALQNGDYPEAIRLLRESVALDDQNPGSFNNLGWVLNAAGDAVGAEESYRRAI